MEHDRRRHLEAVMQRMAAGDEAAACTFYLEFRRELCASVRSAATHLGLRLPADDVEGLAIDVALELGRRAAAWDPGAGALPWTWARMLVRSLVSTHVGLFCDTLDGERAEHARDRVAPWAGPEPTPMAALAHLATRHEIVALLDEALQRVATPRNIEVVLRYAEQRRQGDPSPSHTVGRELGLRAPATRQVVHRVRDRLQRLAATDERFAPLAALPLVQGDAPMSEVAA